MMVPKIFTEREEARIKLLEGARIVYQAVSATYSPMSNNIPIERNWGKPVFSHDGVTVARSISVADSRQNTGVELLKEASEQTNAIAGDGTSATVILAYHLLEKAFKLIAAGYNAMEIRRGMQRAAIDVVAEIEKLAKPVNDEYARHIAAISAGDDALGAMIADTIAKVGGTAGITVEEALSSIVEAEIVEGFHFACGLDHPYMMNDVDMRRAVLDGVWVVPFEGRWRDVSDIRPFLEKLANSEKRNVLIIGDVSGAALATFVENKLKGTANIISVASPVMGAQRSEFLRDIATITGGQVITDQFDWETEEGVEDIFGWAEHVVVTDRTTTITGSDGQKKAIAKRVKELEAQRAMLDDATQIERMEARLAKLNGKVGIIRVGSPTETDRKEKMMRVDDAVCATRAAREEGVVAGGATTLLRIGAKAKELPKGTDEEVGYALVYEAIQEPFKVLLNNCGIEDIGYHKYAVLKSDDGFGYNVRKMGEEPINLFEAGVVDPAKVLKEVVENATANAGLGVTIGGNITQDIEEMRRNNVFNQD